MLTLGYAFFLQDLSEFVVVLNTDEAVRAFSK